MKNDDIIFKEQKKKTTKELKTIRGLCVTCNNTGICSFRSNDASRLIWYCELFDCFVEVEEVLEAAKAILATKPLETSYNKCEGICMNCIKFKTCTLPKSEGGIWHCEEYD